MHIFLTITTDWISAIGTALGTIFAILAVIKLYIKDENREIEIKRLGEMLIEFQKQNQLTESKRKASIRPNFKFKNCMNNSLESCFNLYLINQGKTAIIIDIIYLKEDYDFIMQISKNREIEMGEEVLIKGYIKDRSKNLNEIDYEFDLIFSDEDKNQYKQNIKYIPYEQYYVNPPEEYLF